MAEDILATYEPATARMILDVVRYLKQSGFVIPDGRKRPGIFSQPLIYVQNVSEEEVPAYACMQSTGVVDDDADEELTRIEVDKPADTTGAAGMYLFNGSQPIGIDEGGVGYPGPVLRALIDGSSIMHGDSWGPVVDEWHITPGGIFRMLGADAIAENIAKIFVPGAAGVMFFAARLKAPWSTKAANCDIFTIDGADITDSGNDATVYDPLAIFAILTTGDYVLVVKQNGKYYTVAAPCPA